MLHLTGSSRNKQLYFPETYNFIMGKGHGRAAANNRAILMNPNNPANYSSRASTKAAADNRSYQLNYNNPAYWSSRGTERQKPKSSESKQAE